MKILESLIRSKHADGNGSEDCLHIGANYIAVIDGATSKSAALIEGMTAGRFIAQRLGAFLETAEASLAGVPLAQAMTDCIADELVRLQTENSQVYEGPSASVAICTLSSQTITVVGDAKYMVNGREMTRSKAIDNLLGTVRSVYTRLLMAQQGDEFVAQGDPGRQLILPVLNLQHLLQNNEHFGEYGYGCINGRPIPDQFVEVHRVRPGDEVILCSDGYPQLAPTLEAAEASLREELAWDPLRIHLSPGTKGFAGGPFVSFDDRAYVRFTA